MNRKEAEARATEELTTAVLALRRASKASGFILSYGVYQQVTKAHQLAHAALVGIARESYGPSAMDCLNEWLEE